jgi:hypothetical protein
MTDDTMNASQRQTLKTARCLRVPVLDEDEAIIKSNAKSVGLSTAEYLRRVGRGCTLPSMLDLQAVSELAKINADQGRLGGLLKLWLTDETKFRLFTRARDVRSSVLALLQQLGESQKNLQSAMQQVVKASQHK